MSLLERLFGKKPEIKSAKVQTLREPIVRKVEILQDCVDLVNNSCNFSTVARRYEMMIGMLYELIAYTPEELRQAGVKPGKPFQEYLDDILVKKDIILNQAIKRAYDETVKTAAGLKTEKARCARLARFREEVLTSAILSENNIIYLESLFKRNRGPRVGPPRFILRSRRPSAHTGQRPLQTSGRLSS